MRGMRDVKKKKKRSDIKASSPIGRNSGKYYIVEFRESCEENLRDNLFLLFSLSCAVQYPVSSSREISPFPQVIWNFSV